LFGMAFTSRKWMFSIYWLSKSALLLPSTCMLAIIKDLHCLRFLPSRETHSNIFNSKVCILGTSFYIRPKFLIVYPI
jgi:hypothetical protein